MSDLESELRTMLRTRAQDIGRVPAGLLDGELSRDAGRGSKRWLPALAAAAVVLVVVGLAVALHHTTAPGPAKPTPPACATTLPTQWRAAVRPVDDLGPNAAVWSMNSAGAVVVTGRGQLRIDTGPAHSTLIATAAVPALQAVESDEDTVAYAVSPHGTVTSVVTYDISSGKKLTITQAGLSTNDFGPMVLQDGHVYYAITNGFGPAGAVHDYDLARGTNEVVYRGNTDLFGAHRGYDVYWPGHRVMARISAAAQRILAGVVADPGAHYVYSPDEYAWIDAKGLYRMSADGVVSGPFHPAGEDDLAVQAVAGNYVFFTHPLDSADRQTYVLDTTTGGYTATGLVGPASIGSGASFGGGSTFAITTRGGVHQVDTARLPALHC